jgi:hypothetical protein
MDEHKEITWDAFIQCKPIMTLPPSKISSMSGIQKIFPKRLDRSKNPMPDKENLWVAKLLMDCG